MTEEPTKAEDLVRAALVDIETVDLADLLSETERFVGRFVVFQNRYQRVVVVLWLAHVYAIQAAHATPYLRIKSAVEESGKTTLLELLLVLLGNRAVSAVSISPAAIFRTRDKFGPLALLLDEVDNTIRNRKDDSARDLLALINGGYRESATVIRTTGPQHEAHLFRAFGPAAIAGIGHLHPTTESRCIPIILERKARSNGERWLPFLVESEARWLRERFAAWATDETIERLRAASPEIPEGLRDRQVEGWWILWAIAEEAGAEWPTLARAAALALHLDDEAEETMSSGVLLLSHIKIIFEGCAEDKLPTAALLGRLVENEEGPWGKWWGAEVERQEPPRGAAADLARHLRPFGIRPRTIRMGDETPRGYLREEFEEAWRRYLPAVHREGGETDTTRATSLASNVASVASVAGGHEGEGREALAIRGRGSTEEVREGVGFAQNPRGTRNGPPETGPGPIGEEVEPRLEEIVTRLTAEEGQLQRAVDLVQRELDAEVIE